MCQSRGAGWGGRINKISVWFTQVMSGDLKARTHSRRRGEKRGFNMNDKRQSLISQGIEDGGRREMMLQRMTLKTQKKQNRKVQTKSPQSQAEKGMEQHQYQKQGVTVTQFQNTQDKIDRQNQAIIAKKAGVHSARQHIVNLGTDRSLVTTESSRDDFWLKSLADFQSIVNGAILCFMFLQIVIIELVIANAVARLDLLGRPIMSAEGASFQGGPGACFPGRI